MTQILSVQQKAAPAEGFDDFVKSSDKLSAFNGSPGVGQFRSEITNRASILDITKDLGAQLGVDRIQFGPLVRIMNEHDGSLQAVQKTSTDKYDLIRFVGGWSFFLDTQGQQVQSDTVVGTYMEVVFYGTGLNILADVNNSARDWRATVDGGAEGANFMPSANNVINSRNYNTNQTFNVVKGLALGLHTVKIRFVSGAAGRFFGFEFLNESTSINVKPGTGYSRGREVIRSFAASLAYNSSFESGSLGTRGGRVVAYLKPNGTLAKAVQPVDAVQGNIAGASHVNEEVVRSINYREFGASRSDDFSTLQSGGSSSRSFTLEDGTTGLHGSNVASATAGTPSIDGVTWNTSTEILLTFIGTGLDILRVDTGNGTAQTTNIYVDGVLIGTLSTTATTTARIEKIVSGLPYGSHTVRFERTNANIGTLLVNFIVYQPKKPALPSGMIEIADYNVMADFVYNSAQNVSGAISQGVIRKAPYRELVFFSSSWAVASYQAPDDYGFQASISGVTGAYVEYTFFGTGFDFREEFNTNRSPLNVTLNGLALTTANFPTAQKDVNTSNGIDFDLATGVIDSTTTAGVSRQGVAIKNLPLALYKVRFTTQNTNNMNLLSFNYITPIHSAKSNAGAINNTLPVGNCSILDIRKSSPVKTENYEKYRKVALGLVATPSTTSTTPTPLQDMSLVVESKNEKGAWFEFLFTAAFNQNTVGQFVETRFYLDGTQVGTTGFQNKNETGYSMHTNIHMIFLPKGTYKLDVYWDVSASTGNSTQQSRELTVKEL